MNKYEVKLTQGSTVHSRIIEADSKDDVEHPIKCAVAMGFTGIGSINVTEVKKHRVMWIEHHSWEGYANNEDDAERRAIEYAETQNTFDDYGGFDVGEIEPDRPEITEVNVPAATSEMNYAWLKHLQSMRKTDMETLLDQMPKSTDGDYLPRDARPEIEVSAALVGDYERRTMGLLP